MTDQTVTGTLQKIKERAYNGKTLYSICVDDNWYGLGEEHPGVREHSTVTFQCYKNNKGYDTIVQDTLQVEKEAAPDRESTAPESSNHRQKSIVLQTAFKCAPMIVDTAIKAGAFKPATNTAAAKQKSLHALLAYTDKVAGRLYAYFLDPDAFESQVLSDPPQAEDAGDEFDDPIPF